MKKLFLIILLLVAQWTARAQDPEPFFTGLAPALLDPSRTGYGPGVEATALHQDQWLRMPGVWINDLLQADFNLRNTRKQVNSWMGLGLRLGRDKQDLSGGRLAYAAVAPAMHLRAGHRSYFSSGMELRWTSALYNAADGAWGSQYDGQHYDAGIPSGEVWAADAYTWLEARAGLSWTLKQEAESPRREVPDVLVAGVTADHLGRLMLTRSGAPAPEIPIRYTAYVLGQLPHEIWDDGFFAAELVAHRQGPFHSGRLGVFAGKNVAHRSRTPGDPVPIGFRAGMGYRLQDALLASASVDIGRTSFGMAYGWSVFNRNTSVAGRRTFELVVQVRGSR